MPASDVSTRRFRWSALPLALMIVVLAGAISSESVRTAPAAHRDLTTQPSEGTAATSPTRVTSPHFSTGGCRHCHEFTDAGPGPIKRSQIDALCLECHDGKRASREFHSIGHLFTGDQIVQPDGWPVPNGRLGCVTCHDVRQACQKGRARPENNPAFLRDYTGGHLLSFCARCHVATAEQERYNPHHMLNEDNSPRGKACRFCHKAAIMKSDRRVRTGRPLLRKDDITLCLSCHDRHMDFFEPGHIGITVPAEMRAYMAAAERTAEGQTVDAKLIQEALRTKAEPTQLPLAHGERIVCSTCHNPHQDGLFPAGSVLGDGAIQYGHDRHKPSFRGLGKEVCRACHSR